MIEQIICETDDNYKELSEERKLKYQIIWKSAVCCPSKYVLSVDLASPNSKDMCAVVKYNYEEFIKGNKVIENIEYF